MIKKISRGFSLIEIVIVLAILGVLSIFITITVTAQLQKARDGRRKIDFYVVRNGLEQYFDTKDCYSTKLPDCGKQLSIGQHVYISEVPCDPKTKSQYTYFSDNTACSSWFKLYANLERNDDPAINVTGCRFGCGPQCQYNFGISSPNVDLDRCTPTPGPTNTPMPTSTIGPTNTPTPTPIQYVCGPAAGPRLEGQCEPYAIPTLSECPKIYPDDRFCNYECGIKANRCKNAKGKYKPY